MDTKDLVGCWTNFELELILEPNSKFKIYWPKNQIKGRGRWSINDSELTIYYNTLTISEIKFQLGLKKKRYQKQSKFIVEKIGQDQLIIIDESSNHIKLNLHLDRTNTILKNEITKEIISENLFKAFMYTLLISIFVGQIIRWFINPEIPSWVILVIIFIGSYIYIDKYE
jgi:hypothetical protein